MSPEEQQPPEPDPVARITVLRLRQYTLELVLRATWCVKGPGGKVLAAHGDLKRILAQLKEGSW